MVLVVLAGGDDVTLVRLSFGGLNLLAFGGRWWLQLNGGNVVYGSVNPGMLRCSGDVADMPMILVSSGNNLSSSSCIRMISQ